MRTGAEKTTLDKKLTVDEAIVKGRDTVADALTYLTSSQVRNFYARVINLMDRYAIPGMGTMGVSVQRGRYIFVYDPIFAATVSYEEVCATCEHEVLHLILEQIPRSLSLRKVYASDEDTSLFDITSNLAVDLAANELLARSWPKIKQADKPLGEWVIPEKYEPPLPKDMAYEDYHKLLMELLSKRLKTSPTNLYKLAKQLLKKQIDKVNETLNPPNDKKEDGGQEPQEEQQEGQGEGQGEDDGPGESEGQGSGQGSGQGEGSGQAQSPGQGQGQGQGPSEPEMSPEQLEQEIGNLDPIDQKVLEMLVNSMKSHIGWNAANPDESDTHKAQEHGKEIIKSAYTSMDKSRGTLPGHMVELIRKMLTPPSVSWITLFHNIIQRTKQTKRMRGMARPSKKLSAMKVFAKKRVEEDQDARFIRYARIQQMPVFPGIKQDRKFTVYYVVDTSGSMGTDELRAGLSELLNIQKADSDMTICVIYADTRVCKEYWIDSTGQIDEELTGRGGTDFEAVFVHVQELLRNADKAADVLVYCTDGYAPPPTTRLPIPTVWLLTPRGAPVMSDSGHITILMKDYQLEESSV